MNPRSPHSRPSSPWLPLLLLALAGWTRLGAQLMDWTLWRGESYSPYGLKVNYAKLSADGQRSTSTGSDGTKQSWTSYNLSPDIEIDWRNYIYSPYLLDYSLMFDPSYYYQQQTSERSSTKTRSLLLNGNFNASLLSEKSYATQVSLTRSHQQVQADFYTAQTSDQQTWNVATGYQAGAIPVSFNLQQSREDRQSISNFYRIQQLRLGLKARYKRQERGTSQFDYQYNHYDNHSQSGTSTYASAGRSQTAYLTDWEQLARGATLNSLLNYTQVASAGDTPATTLIATTSYSRSLTEHLSGSASYSFSDNFGAGYRTIQHGLSSGLGHQLYQSLSSSLGANGAYTDSVSGISTLQVTSLGLSGSVGYSKRLGQWGQLGLTNSLSLSQTEQKSAGSEITISNESYVIPAFGPMLIRLRTPLVQSVTSVLKNNIPLDPSEWQVDASTDPWQIQFFSGGPHSVVNGDTVVVTYIVRPNPTGSYSTRGYSAGISLRFWQDRIGLQANYGNIRNHASSAAFVLQDSTQYQFSADTGWRGLRLSVGYARQETTLYTSTSRDASESYARPLTRFSSLSVVLNQHWVHYPATAGTAGQTTQDSAFYNYMLRTQWQPAGGINLSAEAGLQQQRGTLQADTRFAGRIYCDLTYSKLELHLGYEHERREYLRDTSLRDFVFLRARRVF